MIVLKKDLISNIEDINREIEIVEHSVNLYIKTVDKVDCPRVKDHAMKQIGLGLHKKGILDHQRGLLITLLDIRRLSAISDSVIREF